MDWVPTDHRSLGDRINDLWRWGVRLAMRLAIAFGLAVLTAIALGAAVADNGFVQILVTILATLGLWLPFTFLIGRAERFFVHRAARRSNPSAGSRSGPAAVRDEWRRLSTAAPREAHRLSVLQRSLERSRLALGNSDLDPDAHDLCVLIDRRLPDLIHRELDTLPPDDRGRSRQLGDLIDLIEQFARHCSRKRSGDDGATAHEAAILRRRFEAHLTGPGTFSSHE